jgi:hypothetical protein
MPVTSPFHAIIMLFLFAALSGEYDSKQEGHNASGNEQAPRPNILFALADDISYPHMGAYGTAWTRTPAFDRVAGEAGAPQVLLQINVSGEATKAGFSPAALRELELPELAAARVVGLMTMLPYGVPHDDARRMFGEVRRLRDELQERTGVQLPELSMGMSGDAEAAVEEGATLLRIGTALLGPRAE